MVPTNLLADISENQVNLKVQIPFLHGPCIFADLGLFVFACRSSRFLFNTIKMRKEHEIYFNNENPHRPTMMSQGLKHDRGFLGKFFTLSGPYSGLVIDWFLHLKGDHPKSHPLFGFCFFPQDIGRLVKSKFHFF